MKNKHHRKHPPQKKKVHQKKFKKIYLVSIITFAILIILFIIASPFLGKAIFTGSGGTVDLQLVNGNLHLGFNSTDTTRSLTGIYFELSAVTPENFRLCTTNTDLTITNTQGWDFIYQECVNNVLRYGFSPGDPTRLTSAQLNDVLTITPTTAFPESFRLKLSTVDLWTGTQDLFPTETDYFFDYITVQPAAPAAQPASAPSSSGGGGSSLSCKRDWTCNDWSECQNNQQTRTCTDKNNCQKEKTVGGRTYPVTLLGPEMPETTKSCTSTSSKPAAQLPITEKPLPVKVEQPPITAQPIVTKAPNYYIYFLIAGIFLVIIILALVINKFFIHKKTAYNIDELKLWVLQERQAGTSDADIQEILQQKTKWTKEEIDSLLKI
ncbi:hypothetical protein J4437_00145 [Candidatus Woesearchaeota archaeon]|nr:hypothetical protein [Candidatus Woesearchaeota archaeon]